MNAYRFVAWVVLSLAAASLPDTADAAVDPFGPDIVTPWNGYAPDPLNGDGSIGENGAWSFAVGGVSLRLTPLDEEGRWEWIRGRTGAHADPFGSRPDEEPKYVSFVIELRNDSSTVVVFNPGRIWMTGGTADIERPIDLAAMQSAYRMHDREMPGSFESAGAALLHGEAMLQPGQRREGLLVFSRFDKPPKGFLVEIPLMTGSGDPLEFTAAWMERQRLEKALERAERRRTKQSRKERER